MDAEEDFKNRLNYVLVRKLPIVILAIFIALLLLIVFNFKHHKYHKLINPLTNLFTGVLCSIIFVYIAATKYEYIQLKTNYELYENRELLKYVYNEFINKKELI